MKSVGFLIELLKKYKKQTLFGFIWSFLFFESNIKYKHILKEGAF